MWIVMTSAAAMPSSCKYARYRNVAMVQLTQDYTAKGLLPKFISDRARGVLRVVHMGHHNVGKTDRCGYRVTLAEAERRASALNNASNLADVEHLTTWGGSA